MSSAQKKDNVATFVTVGNATQSFDRMLNAVAGIFLQLPQPVLVQHGNSHFHMNNCISRPFVEMRDFNQYIAEAELIIMHAGAGSVIHAIQAGKLPVVMPRLARHGEIVDDHQLEFAQALAQMGKLLIVEEPKDLLSAVWRALSRNKMPLERHQGSPLIEMVTTTLLDYSKAKGIF